MGITIEARNYRGLRHVKWSPSGVCALVGPNGSGKTTLLSLFEFFRVAYEVGIEKAVESTGCVPEFRHLEAAKYDAVTVALTVGDLSWELGCHFNNGSTTSENSCAERLKRGMQVLQRPKIRGTGGKEQKEKDEIASLVIFIKNLRVYTHYNLPVLRDYGSKHTDDSSLNPTGENAFDLLRKWRDQHDLLPKYEFVVGTLVNAFPESFARLDYDSRKDAVSAKLFKPSSNTSLPSRVAPNGWFTAVLHLCAVAGMQPGSLIAIDEFENTLHPYAIQVLIDAFRDWADEHDLTICLATHSPVVLREFNQEPEKVFVMEFGQETLPVALTELHPLEWLKQFSLGDLYAYGEIGNQRRESTPAK